jgi:hypothetical protein
VDFYLKKIVLKSKDSMIMMIIRDEGTQKIIQNCRIAEKGSLDQPKKTYE